MSVRVLTGVAFVIAGLPKFLAFDWERDAFVDFGLPFPELLVILAGVIEVGGGVALLAGRLVVPACLLLIATMAVAIVSSGILNGDVIPSLTVAPLLLVGTAVVLREHAGRRAPSPA